jgi:hypothetical protein
MSGRLPPVFILSLGLVLAACSQDPGTSAGAAGALGGFERAERGCTRQAEDEGLVVEGIQFTQSSAVRRGRITGAETVLVVSREGRTYPMRCRFTYRTGEARLASV